MCRLILSTTANFWKKHLMYMWQIKERSLNGHVFSSYLVHRNFSQLELCSSLTGKKQQYVLLIQYHSVINASKAKYTYILHRRPDLTKLPRRPSHCCSERTSLLSKFLFREDCICDWIHSRSQTWSRVNA